MGKLSLITLERTGVGDGITIGEPEDELILYKAIVHNGGTYNLRVKKKLAVSLEVTLGIISEVVDTHNKNENEIGFTKFNTADTKIEINDIRCGHNQQNSVANTLISFRILGMANHAMLKIIDGSSVYYRFDSVDRDKEITTLGDPECVNKILEAIQISIKRYAIFMMLDEADNDMVSEFFNTLEESLYSESIE